MLPSPGLRDLPFGDLPSPTDHPRPVSWWPYWMLPPPHVLFTTLFPTLQGWRDKTIWDKFVSTISVPSIFLLVITLPVVESESTEDSLVAETLMDIASVRATEPPPEFRQSWSKQRPKRTIVSGSGMPAVGAVEVEAAVTCRLETSLPLE
uniref:Uncharacterized protein n=1 Tax=Bionectria ochroleuca TaxID=29856 RepID=A0A8H7TPH7_BIOOC